ncbi:hypothetical protein [Oceanicoccus sagamiensis]|uniref:Uncharacterized protein n=1 Tax=Oceanicoccus sagamiensis TaxID=716816 RepID=A0A1X9NF92_9GAMM|nr:hypothetical protein [Oceanicoccus sagamiensis]ARN75704.1 hypothetical protein BST96_17275 [Oceanicoccus sagamiensis]
MKYLPLLAGLPLIAVSSAYAATGTVGFASTVATVTTNIPATLSGDIVISSDGVISADSQIATNNFELTIDISALLSQPDGTYGGIFRPTQTEYDLAGITLDPDGGGGWTGSLGQDGVAFSALVTTLCYDLATDVQDAGLVCGPPADTTDTWDIDIAANGAVSIVYAADSGGVGGITTQTLTLTGAILMEASPRFALWSNSSLVLTDETTVESAETLPLYCEYLSGGDLCASYGFLASESATAFTENDPNDTDWLSPSQFPPSASMIDTVNFSEVDFSTLDTLSFKVVQEDLAVDGGSDTVDITTTYTFTCLDCP